MNDTISTKYELAPEMIEKRSLDPKDGKYFQEIYDFMRVKKIGNNQSRNDKYNQKLDRRKRKLRSPLNVNEKVLILAERLEEDGRKISGTFLRQELFAINKQFSE